MDPNSSTSNNSTNESSVSPKKTVSTSKTGNPNSDQLFTDFFKKNLTVFK